MLALDPALWQVSGRLYDGGKEKATLTYETEPMTRLVARLNTLLAQDGA